MAKRILSIVLSLLIVVSACTIAVSAAESDYNAAYQLTTDTAVPKRGDTITITLNGKSDYPVAIATAIIVYDSNYYEIVGSGKNAFTIADDYADVVNVTGTSVAAAIVTAVVAMLYEWADYVI